MDPVTETEQIKRERDLLKQLLDLGTQEEVEPFLEKALALIVTMTGARRGYIELSGSGSAEGRTAGSRAEARANEAPPFSMAHGCSDTEVEKIRDAFSRGIIGDALATGKTVVTSSASEDPRFQDRGSVRRNRIEAVLCAPIGASLALGVVYLQDRDQPGPFSEEDRSRAEMFAYYLGAFADRLLIRRRRRDEIDPTRPYRVKVSAEKVIGRSQALARLLKEVSLVAPLKVNVLLTGPTGTGKTQIARVIHNSGPRETKRFLEINCATVPEGLFESELFGHTRGAFTGAASTRKGLIEETEGGTFFFDEIAELSMTAQAKLLQFLQTKEYLPIGGSQHLQANVRIIAATNADLKEKVAEKEFREDLLARLEGVIIRVPSLVERHEDIAELADFFCRSICEENELPHLKLSVGALCALEAAEWPKNIRQLSSTILHAVLRANGEGDHQIEERHLFPEANGQAGEGQGISGASLTLQAATRRFQEQFVRRTLEEMNWNYSQVKKRLDVSRSSFYQMVKLFKIERPKI